jgi:transcriptional regulator with XRE-family HTH domain
MKSEQMAFAERLRQRLEKEGFSTRPVDLVKAVARHGKISVTQQTISGWLNGTHMPKQGTVRALAHMLRMEPHELQYGEKLTLAVREPHVAWPDHVNGRDRLLFETFLALPAKQRETVRHFIETLSDAVVRKQKPD